MSNAQRKIAEAALRRAIDKRNRLEDRLILWNYPGGGPVAACPLYDLQLAERTVRKIAERLRAA